MEATEIEQPATMSQQLAELLLSRLRPEDLNVLSDGESDLRQQALSLDALQQKIRRLQRDIEQRKSNHETNLLQLRRRHEQKVDRLRGEYDAAIDRGDSAGVDAAMKRLAAVRGDLVNAAKQVEDSETDLSDLIARQSELRMEALKFVRLMGSLTEVVKALRSVAGRCLATSGESIGGDIREVERIIEQSKKIAGEILSE